MVLTDILIELTKNNKFGLKSPAIARHLIIHNNIYQFGKQVKLILILLLLLLLLLLVVEVLVNLPDTNAVTSLADLLLTTCWSLLVQCGRGGNPILQSTVDIKTFVPFLLGIGKQLFCARKVLALCK